MTLPGGVVSSMSRENETPAPVLGSSLYFDGSSRLERQTGTSSINTFTFSAWIKRSTIGSRQCIFYTDTATNHTTEGAGGSGVGFILREPNDYANISGFGGYFHATSGSQLFQDTSNWYHIVWRAQTGTHTVWINNQQIISYSVGTDKDDYKFARNCIGFRSDQANYTDSWAPTSYFNGYMADIYFVDGQALDQTNFGETNSLGSWVPKNYAGTYGTNGYNLNFTSQAFNFTGSAVSDPYNSGTNIPANGIADASGNGNHWTMI